MMIYHAIIACFCLI